MQTNHVPALEPQKTTTIQKQKKKSRSGDTLGPVELIVWPKQGNQGDWHEQDDQGEVSIIIFGMSQDFENIAYVGLIRHFVFS